MIKVALLKYKAIILRISKILVCITLLFGLFVLLNKMYVDEDELSRTTYHEFYLQNDVDTLFLGSSHVYCGVIPQLVDAYLGTKSYNLATSSQIMSESYDNLVEACRVYNIKNVYVDVYYTMTTGQYDYYSSLNEISWSNWSYWKWSPNKIRRVINETNNDRKIEALFPFVRFRDHLFDTDWIEYHIELKESDKYRKFIYEKEHVNGEKELYGGKGAILTTKQYEDNRELYRRDRSPEEMKLGDNTKDVLKKMVEFCRKRDIGITFIVTPMYEEQVRSVDYDMFYNSVLEFAKEENVPFWDFNLCKSELLPIQNNEYFLDEGHLNTYGANVFDEALCRVIAGKDVENQKLFYSSYEEKMRTESPKTYGMYYYHMRGEEPKKDSVCIAASQPDMMEYKLGFEQVDEDNNVLAYTELQDWGNNMCFEIDTNKRGTFYLEWRYKGQETAEESMTFSYRLDD